MRFIRDSLRSRPRRNIPRQPNSNRPLITVATTMKDQWGTSPWRTPQIPRPAITLTTHTSAPVEN